LLRKNNPMEMHNHEHMQHSGKELYKHEGHSVADFKKRFFIILILIFPILILSLTIQNFFNFNIQFSFSNYLMFLLSSIVVLYGGFPFFIGAIKEIRTKNFGMMTLVSIAVLSGYFYSVGATFFFAGPDFYWEISTLVLFLLFGHWMEMKSVVSASGALNELVKLIPQNANLIKGKEIVEISTDKLKIGDLILVKSGEKVPVDGIILEGESAIDESMITGESNPISKSKGGLVIGGSLNLDGVIKIRVSKTGEGTVLNQIIELVKQAQTSKPRTQRLADKAANYLTIVAISVGVLTLFYWNLFTSQTFLFSLTLSITVIVIACPHALGLAIPIVTTISTTLAAKNGILIRDMKAIETAEKLDYVLFDKTGTLTKGVFEVTDIIGEKTLEYASAVELFSEHIIAKSIVSKAKVNKIKIDSVKNFKNFPGKGSSGSVNGKQIFVGNLSLIKQFNIKREYEKDIEKFSSQGKTIVCVADKKKVLGLIILADVVREESKEAIKILNEMGIKTAMLTGDNKKVAEYVAKELRIDEVFSEVLPKDKSNYVKKLQEKGKVAMVGDGINDAPALAQADVGIAIGSGTEIASQSAQIVLVKNNPLDVVRLINLSKETKKKMKQNLLWATGYNVVAIPLASGALYSFGILLRPEWGALFMATSSIIVVLNTLLMKRRKI